jgi:E3 UFM1-protein ligase 1
VGGCIFFSLMVKPRLLSSHSIHLPPHHHPGVGSHGKVVQVGEQRDPLPPERLDHWPERLAEETRGCRVAEDHSRALPVSLNLSLIACCFFVLFFSPCYTLTHLLTHSPTHPLTQAGKLSIGELSTRFDLPSDFLLSAITTRLGMVHDRLHSPTAAGGETFLYTDAYLRACVRGAFSALTRPVSLLSVAQQQHMEQELFAGELTELLRSGRLHGTLQENRGGNTTFLPQVFVHARDHYIDSFAAANSFIPYDHLRTQFQLSNPERTLARRIPGGLSLSTCYATPTLISRLDAAVAASLASASWLQISPILPSSLSEADVAHLLQHCQVLNEAIAAASVAAAASTRKCSSSKSEDVASTATLPPLLIEDEYLVSGSLLQKVVDTISLRIRLLIAHDPQLFQVAHEQLRRSLDATASPQIESRSEKQAQRKKQRNKKKRSKAAARAVCIRLLVLLLCVWVWVGGCSCVFSVCSL